MATRSSSPTFFVFLLASTLFCAAIALPSHAWANDEADIQLDTAAIQAEAQVDPTDNEHCKALPSENTNSGIQSDTDSNGTGNEAEAPATSEEPGSDTKQQTANKSEGAVTPENTDSSTSATDNPTDPSKDESNPEQPKATESSSVSLAEQNHKGWETDSAGVVRFYGTDGKAHTGWLVDSGYKNYGLQRYWFDKDGALTFSKLIDEAEAGWWAYATQYGYVVRGRYVDPTTGYIYLADNDGKLEDAGWVVSNKYGQGLQRYYIDAETHSAKPGYSTDGWSHYTIDAGYVVRGAAKSDNLVYLADNDGVLADTAGWLVSNAYGQGLQRYWIDGSKHAAVVGYSADGWAHYTTDKGYVARDAYKKGSLVYLANNDGKLADAGWIVSKDYGQGLQRYWIDESAHAAITGLSMEGWAHFTRDEGYVARGFYRAPSGVMYLANNDGLLAEGGWLVSNAYGQGLQRYWIDGATRGMHQGISSAGWLHYTTSQGYVLRNGECYVKGRRYRANNDGLLVELSAYLAQKIVNQCYREPATSTSECAKWVNNVYQHATGTRTQGDANDLYFNICSYSNADSLVAGMIIASGPHLNHSGHYRNGAGNYTGYGHVGIYVGNNKVMHCKNGRVLTSTLSDWIAEFTIKCSCRQTMTAKWGFPIWV